MLRTLLFTLSLIGLSFSYTSITASEFSSHDALIDAIVANADDCVAGCHDEKIYLKADRIIPTDKGLFLNLNGQDYVALSLLGSDEKGCYLGRDVRHLVQRRCQGCDRPYTFSCRTQGCRFNPDTHKGK